MGPINRTTLSNYSAPTNTNPSDLAGGILVNNTITVIFTFPSSLQLQNFHFSRPYSSLSLSLFLSLYIVRERERERNNVLFTKMPDLGNLSLSSSLALTNLKLVPDPDPPKTLDQEACHWDQRLRFPILHKGEASDVNGNGNGNGNGIRVLKRSRGSLDRPKKANNGKSLEDHVKAWALSKMELGVPESHCSLPFLVGAPKMVPTFLLTFEKLRVEFLNFEN